MLNDIRNELLKIISQKKNYIAVAGHLLLMGLCIYGIKKSAELYRLARIGKMGIELADFQSFLDGFFFARLMIIPSFVIIMPILVCTVGGDMIAGEVQDGSLRLYASRSRGRIRIIFSKISAMYLFSFAYCVYFGAASILAGYFFFGWQNTQIIPLLDLGMGTDMEIIRSSQCLLKYALLVIYYSFSTMALGCITLFFSTVFNRMTSATVAGITLYFVSYIFESLPLLVSLRPYLLSHAMNGCALFWLEPIPVYRIIFNMLVLLSYMLIFSSATLVIFKNKDIG